MPDTAPSSTASPKVAVVGAGLAGLTAAFRLAAAGIRPVVFERYPKPGGLARVANVNGEDLEVFYHHLFTSDTAYIGLATELGIADSLEWLASRMGIWSNDRLWDFGTPLSLLRFSPLGLRDKLRFAVTTLKLQQAEDPTEFENVTAAHWLQEHCGEKVWKTIWFPLLRQKFADMADEVAMVWLWRKISLRGRSRSRIGAGEKLGYMRGSFSVLVDALAHRITRLGGEIRCRDQVRRIDLNPGGGLEVVTNSGSTRVQRVLASVSPPDYLDLAGHLLAEDSRRRLAGLRATGALCTLLELDRSVTPFYWLNVADSAMPFGGLIEHTNLLPKERYGGAHLLYISNYLVADHPLFRAPRHLVMQTYLPGLKRINPAFDPSWIQKVHHFRADYAQPVVTPGYRRQIPPMRTGVQGLYLCCMAQIYPEDRGQNYAIMYGDRAAKLILEDEAAAAAP